MLISKDENVAGRVVEHVQSLEAEVNVLKHLDHPNIVRYLVRSFRGGDHAAGELPLALYCVSDFQAYLVRSLLMVSTPPIFSL